MARDTKREDKTLDNILKAIDAEPVKISKGTRFKQSLIRLTSNRIFAFSVKLIPFAVLFVLLLHIILSSSHGALRGLSLVGHQVKDGHLYVTVSNASIDAEKSYMESSDGEKIIHPELEGIRENIAVFEYDGKEYNIFLYSTDGRSLQMLIDSK